MVVSRKEQLVLIFFERIFMLRTSLLLSSSLMVAIASNACPNVQLDLPLHSQDVILRDYCELPEEVKTIVIDSIEDLAGLSKIEVHKNNSFKLSFVTSYPGLNGAQWNLDINYDKESLYLDKETKDYTAGEQSFSFMPLKEGVVVLKFDIDAVWGGTLFSFSHLVEIHIDSVSSSRKHLIERWDWVEQWIEGERKLQMPIDDQIYYRSM